MLFLMMGISLLMNLSTESLAQSNPDRSHYSETQGLISQVMYAQMWYFNFVDDQNDIAGVIGAGIVNPKNVVFANGQTTAMTILLRDPKEGRSFTAWSPRYNPKTSGNLQVSETFSPDLGMQFENPSMTIKVLNDDEYEIKGVVSQDGITERFDLTYTRANAGLGASWIPWDNVTLPKLFNVLPGKATYTMQMPYAIVNGKIEVIDSLDQNAGNRVYTIVNARGYHDGFYGSATLVPAFRWNWVSFQQENLAIELIDPHGPIYSCKHSKSVCTPGNLRISYREGNETKNFYFKRDQIQITYPKTAIDPEYPKVTYPTEAIITAKDEVGNKLQLKWKLKRYIKVFYDPPKPLKNTPTFEIEADFSGNFYPVNAVTPVRIQGSGWADYSDGDGS